MNILDLVQGTEEWCAARSLHHNASEAPAMMGDSTHCTRTELLRMKFTGVAREVSDYMQRFLFDKGHAAEEAALPYAEEIIGEPLYPVTGENEVDGLKLLASFDGLTMNMKTGWEHKDWNEALAARVRNGVVPASHHWQLDHQAVVANLDRILFMVSDGTPDRMVWTWYTPSQERRARLLAGWHQFNTDLQNYQVVLPAKTVVAEAVVDLPAVTVKVSGAIDIIDNFIVFEERLRDFLDNQLVREPQTDQDFVNLAAQIASLKKAEAALDAAEAAMLAQISTVDTAKRTKDMLHKLTSDNRLMAEKLLSAEKDKRKQEILVAAQNELIAHIQGINKTLGANLITLPTKPGLFAPAIAGLKSVDSMRAKVNAAMTKEKLDASAMGDRIHINRACADDYMHLLPDFVTVCTKQEDDFAALVSMRRNEEAERKLAEELRIRAEERARAEEAARVATEAEKQRIREQVRAEEEAKAKADARLADAILAKQAYPRDSTELIAPNTAPEAQVGMAAEAATTPVAQPVPMSAARYEPGPSPTEAGISQDDLQKMGDMAAAITASPVIEAFLSASMWESYAEEDYARSLLIRFEQFRTTHRTTSTKE